MRWRQPRRNAEQAADLASAHDVAAVACRAPRTSMAFDAFGDVRSCYRSEYRYGRVGTASLQEIWHGPTRADLVAAIDRADYGLGCTHCEWQTNMGTAHLAFARRYDDLPLEGPGTWPRQLEFALSNTCNLQCQQCTGLHSSAIRSQREHLPPIESPYDERFYEELRPFLDHVEIARFTGGEPFLGRSTQRVWDLMLESSNRPTCTMVTNATQWNDRVERLLEELGFQVTVSLDAIDPATLSATRVGIDPERVFANIERFRDAARRNGTWLGLSYCMMTTTWQEFGAIVRYADERDMTVDCSVVTDPHELSLHHLSRAELGEVVRHLEREDAEIGPHLGRNRAVWDAELERLQAALDQPEEAVARAAVQVEITRFRSEHPETAVPAQPVSLRTLFAGSGGGGDAGSEDGVDTDDPAADLRSLTAWLGASSLAIVGGTVLDDVIIECAAGPGTDWLGAAGLVGGFVWSARDAMVARLGHGGVSDVLERTSTRIDEVTRHTRGGVSFDVRSILVRRRGASGTALEVRSHMACRPVDHEG